MIVSENTPIYCSIQLKLVCASLDSNLLFKNIDISLYIYNIYINIYIYIYEQLCKPLSVRISPLHAPAYVNR